MKLSVILLFLQLWGNVEVSLSLSACSTLPDVAHALVPEEARKADYQEGDVIDFICEPGYTSGQISKYVCTRVGWLSVRLGTCYSCSVLPDVPHALVSEETKKADYQEGDVIHFICEPGYASGPTIKYVCTTKSWLAVNQGTCSVLASSCDPPPAYEGLTVKGLPENNDPIVPHHIIIFSCDDPGKYLDGSSVLICGEDGQWNIQFPSCIDITCPFVMVRPHIYVAGLPPDNEAMKIGHRLQFQCRDDSTLEGSEEIECLQTGEWSAATPTCSGIKCPAPAISNGDVRGDIQEYNENDFLHFVCKPGYQAAVKRLSRCIKVGSRAEWSPTPACEPPAQEQ